MEQLWLFVTLTFFVSASPGPVMLSCMIDAARFGLGHSWFTMLGASAGNLVLILLSALGLSLVIHQAEWIFHTIKWLGAAYLAYLGLKLYSAAVLPISLARQQVRRNHLFGRAFMVAITNPKGLIYFGALLPQFIQPQQPIAAQFALLAMIFLAIDLVWMLVYAKGGKMLMYWLQAPSHQRWFNRLCGAALLCAGIALAFSQR